MKNSDTLLHTADVIQGNETFRQVVGERYFGNKIVRTTEAIYIKIIWTTGEAVGKPKRSPDMISFCSK